MNENASPEEKPGAIKPSVPLASGGKPRPRAVTALLVIVLVALVVAAGIYFDYRSYVKSPEPALDTERLVVIERGMSFSRIADLLSKERVISSKPYFKLLARVKGVTTRMQAGEYTFRPGFSPLMILDMISEGDVTTWKLAVPEGLDIYDMARRLSGLGAWSEQAFIDAALDPKTADSADVPLDTLEGYLFPAVYDLRLSMSEDQIVEMMLRRGLRERTPERVKKARALGLTWHQALTLASLIEKETPVKDERPIIAGIFLKRIERNMPLQSDPTAIYGLRDFKGPITKKDLARQTPYNTYLHKGLPPGPICSPGADAIDAALSPKKTGYLYFVAKGDGSHAFSRTYAEHKKNINKYRNRN